MFPSSWNFSQNFLCFGVKLVPFFILNQSFSLLNVHFLEFTFLVNFFQRYIFFLQFQFVAFKILFSLSLSNKL